MLGGFFRCVAVSRSVDKIFMDEINHFCTQLTFLLPRVVQVSRNTLQR